MGVKQEKLPPAELQKHACYVLITCGEPSPEGKMQVEMTYSGDATLAAFLLASAQHLLEEE